MNDPLEFCDDVSPYDWDVTCSYGKGHGTITYDHAEFTHGNLLVKKFWGPIPAAPAEDDAPHIEVTKALKQILLGQGWTLLRTRSHQLAETKLRIAENREQWAIRDQVFLRERLREAADEQRRLMDRLTFVYETAIAHGVTVDELRGPKAE